MKSSWRAVLCAVVMVCTTSAFKACKSDGPSTGGEDPPTTADDKFVVGATGTMALEVLANDTKLDHEPLTYAIDGSPTVGSAAFNDDHTVALTLPADFKGMTKFRYKITNSVGGFSISSAVVFVDVPAYRSLFAAKNSAGAYELYVSDFLSTTKISNAVTGNVRLQNMWHSKNGLLVAYERADPAQVASTTELFFVNTATNGSPVKFPLASGRALISGAPVSMSDDSRWIAYPTNPTGNSNTATNLYVLDANSAGSPTAVGSSEGTFTTFTQWIGTAPTLYFMATPRNINGGHALFRAGTGSLDAAERVSPVYAAGNQEVQALVSPDEERILIRGTHGSQSGAFFIDPANPNIERRLTTDVPAGVPLEDVRVDEDVTKLVYLWRLNATTARVSVVDISANATPQTVFQGDVIGLSDLRLDGLAALITRGPTGAGTDGTLYEVMLDRSANSLITPNVTGGVYDGTGDRVYLFSRTLAPSVIKRSDFERTPSALVRTSTPAATLFAAPIFEPSAAILEDASSSTGIVLVNAAAPGKTLEITDMRVDTPPALTLYPTFIAPAP